MAHVELADVRKSFGATEVIRGVNLKIKDGEFIAFVGPSGCGKSTLLRLAAGLEEADSGDIRMNGESVNDLSPAERGVAMVFQSYALYPHMTARQNMAFGLRRGRLGGEGVKQRVEQAAEILNLGELLSRKPAQLSGGQRQRVAIGRAIVREPRVFLFDEPLSNLDAELRARMRVEIALLHRRLGTTMIYVTHDQVEAMTLADRIAVLSAGKVEQLGAPLELYDNPANMFVASFLGSPKMNMLACSPDGNAVQLTGGGRLQTARQTAEGAATHAGIRPEHVALTAADAKEENQARGKASLVERLGADTFLHVNLADGETVVARAAADCRAQAGDEVTLHFPPRHVHLFAADGQAITSAK